jgi:YD repeat-containing protein
MKTMRFLTILLFVSPLAAAAQEVPAPISYSATYTYDEASRLTGAEIDRQMTISYAYDASGRILSATHDAFSGVAVEPVDSSLPREFALREAYPNPFNPVTTIGFDLPEASRVQIAIFDMLGRRVALLVDGAQEAGRHQIQWDAARFASGAYLIEMRTADRRFSQPVLLLR